MSRAREPLPRVALSTRESSVDIGVDRVGGGGGDFCTDAIARPADPKSQFHARACLAAQWASGDIESRMTGRMGNPLGYDIASVGRALLELGARCNFLARLILRPRRPEKSKGASRSLLSSSGPSVGGRARSHFSLLSSYTGAGAGAGAGTRNWNWSRLRLPALQAVKISVGIRNSRVLLSPEARENTFICLVNG
jgi:hypothetical protein